MRQTPCQAPDMAYVGKCKGCGRKRTLVAHDECATCYQRNRRNRMRGGPAAPRAARGEGGRVSLRINKTLREAIEVAARAAGLPASMWMRRTLEQALRGHRKEG